MHVQHEDDTCMRDSLSSCCSHLGDSEEEQEKEEQEKGTDAAHHETRHPDAASFAFLQQLRQHNLKVRRQRATRADAFGARRHRSMSERVEHLERLWHGPLEEWPRMVGEDVAGSDLSDVSGLGSIASMRREGSERSAAASATPRECAKKAPHNHWQHAPLQPPPSLGRSESSFMSLSSSAQAKLAQGEDVAGYAGMPKPGTSAWAKIALRSGPGGPTRSVLDAQFQRIEGVDPRARVLLSRCDHRRFEISLAPPSPEGAVKEKGEARSQGGRRGCVLLYSHSWADQGH
jgi:hypothetical protein